MSAPSRPAWTRYRGYPSAAEAGLRVSDAERNEVADELSRHYGDGRLDEAEFNQRLDQAMQAKTRSDLSGLLDDLPSGLATLPGGRSGPPPAPRRPTRPDRPPRGRRRFRPIELILFVIIAVILGHIVTHIFFTPWLLIAVLAFLWLRYRPHHYRRP
jgi:hypothetical protein